MSHSEPAKDEQYWQMSIKDRIKAMRLEEQNKAKNANNPAASKAGQASGASQGRNQHHHNRGSSSSASSWQRSSPGRNSTGSSVPSSSPSRAVSVVSQNSNGGMSNGSNTAGGSNNKELNQFFFKRNDGNRLSWGSAGSKSSNNNFSPSRGDRGEQQQPASTNYSNASHSPQSSDKKKSQSHVRKLSNNAFPAMIPQTPAIDYLYQQQQKATQPNNFNHYHYEPPSPATSSFASLSSATSRPFDCPNSNNSNENINLPRERKMVSNVNAIRGNRIAVSSTTRSPSSTPSRKYQPHNANGGSSPSKTMTKTITTTTHRSSSSITKAPKIMPNIHGDDYVVQVQIQNSSPPRIVRGNVPAEEWSPQPFVATSSDVGDNNNELQDFSVISSRQKKQYTQIQRHSKNGEIFVERELASKGNSVNYDDDYDVEDYTSFGFQRQASSEQKGRAQAQAHREEDVFVDASVGGCESADGIVTNEHEEEVYDSYESDQAVEDGRLLSSAQSDERAVVVGYSANDGEAEVATNEAASSVNVSGKSRRDRSDAHYRGHHHHHHASNLQSDNSPASSRGCLEAGYRGGSNNDGDIDDDLSLAFADISFSKSDQIDRLSAAMVSTSKGEEKDFAIAAAVKKSTTMNALLDQLSRDKAAMDDTDVSVYGGDWQLKQIPSDSTPVRTNISSKKTRPSLAKRAEQAYQKRRERSSSLPPSPSPTKTSSSPKVARAEDEEKTWSSPSKSQHTSPPKISTGKTDDENESSNLTKSYDSEVSVPLDEPALARKRTNAQLQMNSPRVIIPSISTSKSNGSESSNTSPRARMKAKLMAAKNHRKATVPTSPSSPSSLPRTRTSQQSPAASMNSTNNSRAGAPSPFSEESYEDFLAKLQQVGAVNMAGKKDCDNSVASDQTEKISNVNEMEEYESIRSVRTAPSEISASSPAMDDMRMQSLSSYMMEHPVRPTSEAMSDASSQVDEKNNTQQGAISFESLVSAPQIAPSQSNDFLANAPSVDENEHKIVQSKPSEDNGIGDQIFSMLSNTFVDMGKIATDLLEGGAAMIDDITPALEEHNKAVHEYANNVLGIDTIVSSVPTSRINQVDSVDEAVAIEVEYIEDNKER